ncbi:hypothetical protein [Cyclobacterium xiamenense]|uniref:hypothetical protein n=1 Tax=Cyclobacterium xiamenense TaxID=1297121 RepID=UPI001F509476|nr:hypothetical protein [Cyclobacterium xiamenense]
MIHKQKNLISAIVLMLFFASIGCTPEEDIVPGTGDGTMGLLFKLQGNSTTAANARTNATGLHFTDGFIQIQELELELEGDFDTEGLPAAGSFDDDDDEDGDEWEYEIEFDEIKKVTFDQFDSDADFFIQIPEGIYEEIEMEIDLIDYQNEPSIQLNGTYTNGDNEEVPFRYEYFGDEIDFEVEIEAENGGFRVDRVNNPLILFELIPSRWFSTISGAELDDADLDETGVMVISRTSNVSIYRKISDKIAVDAEIEIEID